MSSYEAQTISSSFKKPHCSSVFLVPGTCEARPTEINKRMKSRLELLLELGINLSSLFGSI